MIQWSNVTVGFKNKSLMKDLHLEILEKKISAIIGPNAYGKTTLLKSLSGLIPPLAGEIKKSPPSFSILEAESSLPFSLTVKELLSIGNPDEQILSWAQKSFKIEELLNSDMLLLSSGQKRRVWLVHCLCQNVPIYFLDEPFSHLDLFWQKNLIGLLKEFKNKFGKTLVLVAHELEHALNLADQILLITKNQSVISNTAELVFHSQDFFETFAFKALIDENPIDKTKRLTLGK